MMPSCFAVSAAVSESGAFSVPAMAARWGIAPEASVTLDRVAVSGAIWAGRAEGTPQELDMTPDPETHVIGVGLTSYHCEPFADGKRLHSGQWIPGRARIMAAGVTPRALVRGRWRILHIYVPHRLVARAFDAAPGTVEIIDPIGAPDPVLSGLADSIVAEMVGGGPASAMHVESLSLALTVHLVRRWSNHAQAVPASPACGGLAGWQVRRVTEYIQDRLADEVSLDELARLVGLSPRHLCTAFRQSTGLPPHRWQIERRVERAKQMLADPAHSITDVALACGFGSSAHFATMFRRAVGQTPREWRRRVS